MLVPGAIWRFEVLEDLRTPANVGEVIEAHFVLDEAGAESTRVAFEMESEFQLLEADLFGAEILSHELSNSASGSRFLFDPALIHFAYPFGVGDSWGASIEFEGSLNGVPAEGGLQYGFEVVDAVTLDTPAGSFDTLLVTNDLVFLDSGLELTAHLWVTENGLLARRDSYVAGIRVQSIVLSSFEIAPAAALAQLSQEMVIVENVVAASYDPTSDHYGCRAKPLVDLARASLDRAQQTIESCTGTSCRWRLGQFLRRMGAQLGVAARIERLASLSGGCRDGMDAVLERVSQHAFTSDELL